MSLVDLTERLARSLLFSAELMNRLCEGMASRRTAWISARPSTLEDPATALDRLAAQLADEQSRREQLLEQARQLLPALPGVASDKLRIDITLLSRHVPATAGQRLTQAGAKATAAATRVRTEQAFGSRLLEFSQRAHDSLLHNVVEAVDTQRTDVGGYDMRARRVQGAFTGGTSNGGTLIDGRV